MYYDIFISGFGGQGILLAGQLLAEAGMKKGLNVTFFPSYGVEMRGGTARCTVVLSDEDIGSPIVDNPKCVIAMNQPSLVRYQKSVSPGGILIVNSSLARVEDVKSDGLKTCAVPMSELAMELGNGRLANMVGLGAFAQLSGALSPDEVAGAVESVVSARNRKFIPMNEKAIREGARYARENAGG
ncbi:MAG: 2-oxoacid:ferredoxin oxidoreductase subunit gamma [Deltaproteobacteria bacterium]|nr:2-oxoacid:ferredoxin oxidoreductase subunit gamma [Deltaproteobacteria bacterium]